MACGWRGDAVGAHLAWPCRPLLDASGQAVWREHRTPQWNASIDYCKFFHNCWGQRMTHGMTLQTPLAPTPYPISCKLIRGGGCCLGFPLLEPKAGPASASQ